MIGVWLTLWACDAIQKYDIAIISLSACLHDAKYNLALGFNGISSAEAGAIESLDYSQGEIWQGEAQ